MLSSQPLSPCRVRACSAATPLWASVLSIQISSAVQTAPLTLSSASAIISPTLSSLPAEMEAMFCSSKRYQAHTMLVKTVSLLPAETDNVLQPQAILSTHDVW
jgi:hypothetical protein